MADIIQPTPFAQAADSSTTPAPAVADTTPVTPPAPTATSDQPVADPTPHPKVMAVGIGGVSLTVFIAALVGVVNIFFPDIVISTIQMGYIATVVSGIVSIALFVAGYLTSSH